MSSLSVFNSSTITIKHIVPLNDTSSLSRVVTDAEGAPIVILNLDSSLEDQIVIDAAIEKAVNSATAANATRLNKRNYLGRGLFDDDDDEEKEEEKEEKEEEEEEEQEEKEEEEEKKEEEEEEKKEEKKKKEENEEQVLYRTDDGQLIVAPKGLGLTKLMLMSPPESVSSSEDGLDPIAEFKKDWAYVWQRIASQEALTPETRDSIFRPVMLMLRKRLIGSALLGLSAVVIGPVLGVKLTKDHKIAALPEPKTGFIITNPDGSKQEINL